MLRTIALLCLCSFAAYAAEWTYVSEYKFSGLSGAAAVLTIQQPASSARTVQGVAAWVYCSVACEFVIERDGTAATATSITPQPVPDGASAASATAWRSSNVGVGRVIGRYIVAAGSMLSIDLTFLEMKGNGTGKNFTVRTAGITGEAIIGVQHKER